jgi:uncharacterized protein YkwD
MMRWIGAVLLAAAGLPATAGGEVEDRVLEAVQAARAAAGVAPLERRADLDRVAAARAGRVAALSRAQWGQRDEPVGEDLRRAGIAFRRSNLHLDANRGYVDPADAFVRSWSGNRPAWESAVSGGYDAVGLATARTREGWMALVGVFVEDEEPPRPRPDPAELEERAVAAVNRARVEQGRAALEVNDELAAIARAHSRDMIRRLYFDHVAPDGVDATDRVRRRGVSFARVGENLHRNQGYDDAVDKAIRSWLSSPEHRELLLVPEFRETGLGVAVDEDGTVYFTQLFLEPPRFRTEPREGE